ncbi:MAG: tRNA-binding protein [Pseudomonadales bacterium]|nr:tRNA-binding protein [Pseudomonadales bacterium]
MRKPEVSWDVFNKLDLRVGTVERAESFPQAKRPAIKLWLSFGPEVGVLKTSAQITDHYQPEALLGRQLVAVVNFPPKQIANFMSECLVVGALEPSGAVVLLGVDWPVDPGLQIA